MISSFRGAHLREPGIQAAVCFSKIVWIPGSLLRSAPE